MSGITESKMPTKAQAVRRILFYPLLLLAWWGPHRRIRAFSHSMMGINLGKKVEIGYFVTLDMQHPELIMIEDEVCIVNGAIIIGHDHSWHYSRGEDIKLAKVIIKKRAFIGGNAVILPGVTIGERAIVGAGAVVTKDVPDEWLAVGVPAKIFPKE
jgi:acetyltransferase-like isoleucine patch superfamily enzyme